MKKNASKRFQLEFYDWQTTRIPGFAPSIANGQTSESPAMMPRRRWTDALPRRQWTDGGRPAATTVDRRRAARRCQLELGHLGIILLFAALRAAAAAECGDGLQEEGEACEDGNHVRFCRSLLPLPISTA